MCAFTSAGSSPLTRGKHFSALSVLLVRGLIPAHAGKTDVPELDYHSGRAHPRSRGENRGLIVRLRV